MKDIFKIIVVLTFICSLCAFLLSFVNSAAREKIEINAKQRIKDAISNLAPNTKAIKEIKVAGEVIYQLINNKNNMFAYAFLAEGQGYQGTIKILVVADVSLEKLYGIEVVESVETPGLGAKIEREPFRGQFENINVSKSIICIKEDITQNNQIKAITGATVSSRAVVNILNKKITELKGSLAN